MPQANRHDRDTVYDSQNAQPCNGKEDHGTQVVGKTQCANHGENTGEDQKDSMPPVKTCPLRVIVCAGPLIQKAIKHVHRVDIQ